VPKKSPKTSDFLTKAQTTAILKLLRGHSRGAIAKDLGINERTVRRWLQQPAFSAELRRQRQAVFNSAIARMHGSLELSVSVLQNAIAGQAVSTEQAAAVRTLLGAVQRFQENSGIEERVSALEEAQQERISELEAQLADLEDSQFLDTEPEDFTNDEDDD
jgi:DNA-binding transcriptional MerR regulator